MNHPTSFELQKYVDAVILNGEKAEIDKHLDHCSACAVKIQSMKKLDTVIRQVPLDRPSINFTNRVMVSMNKRASSSLGWVILKNLAPVVGIIVILYMVYSVLQLTGSSNTSEVNEWNRVIQSSSTTVHNTVSACISDLNGWLKSVFPFLYMKSSYGLMAFLVVLFALVAILDKAVIFPIFKRKM